MNAHAAAVADAVADAAAEGPGSLVQVYLALGVPVLRWLQVPVCHEQKEPGETSNPPKRVPENWHISRATVTQAAGHQGKVAQPAKPAKALIRKSG